MYYMDNTIPDCFNRMLLIETHYEVILSNADVFSYKIINEYIDASAKVQILKYFIDNTEIWSGIIGVFFQIIIASGKVKMQIGGGGNGHLFWFLLILLMMASLNFSQQLTHTTKNYDVALHNSLETRAFNNNAGLSVVVPGATQRMVLGFPVPNEYSQGISKMISTFSRNTSSLVHKLRRECGNNVAYDPGVEESVFTTRVDGQISAERFKGPILMTPGIACNSIPSTLFKFEKTSGKITYVPSDFTLSEIVSVISTVATNIDNDIRTIGMTGEVVPFELKNAYNKIVIILKALDEINKLINLQGIPEIVSDADIIASDRESALQEYLDSILDILKYATDVTGASDASAYIQTTDALKRASDDKTLAEMRGRISQGKRDANKIDSDAIKADRIASITNAYAETIDPLATLGTNVLNTTVSASKTIMDAAGDVIFSPLAIVDKGLKELEHLIVDNAFILFIALLGVGVAGVVSFKIAKDKTITIVTFIKTVVLSPITIPWWIGKQVYKVFYKPDKEALIADMRQLQKTYREIDNNRPSDTDYGAMQTYLDRKEALAIKIDDLKRRVGKGITRRVKRNKKYPTKNKKYGKLRKFTKYKKRGTKRK